jgi:hypothetical protein
MCDAALIKTVESLLAARGLADGAVKLRAVAGGGNNRVYIVEGAAVPVVAKKYFNSARDQRDRLHAEWSFINYAHAGRLGCVPRPIASDRAAQLALYERIDGRKLQSPGIAERDVLAAAEFFRALNDPARRTKAGNLPHASEGGFSIAEHFALIDSRVTRLLNTDDADVRNDGAGALIEELNDCWQDLKTSVARKVRTLSLRVDETLSPDLRCVSPSDFGFHNALKRQDGNICFIDFEYAGWDDPAKMAADFFLQPEVPVERRFFQPFVRAIFEGPLAEWHQCRVELLQPVFALKWCCIMLNPYVADRAQAGNFVNPARDESERKRTQLKKASAALAALQTGEGEWRM